MIQVYDFGVVSDLYEEYYLSLARMLVTKFDLNDGCVFDVGCGSGKFLRILCAMKPGIRGVGIDPCCEPSSNGNLTLIRDNFSPRYFANTDIRLVLLRHVLGHIYKPMQFLSALRASIGEASLFLETADLDWIFDNGTFWDFCYEYCNYFTLASLRAALSLASFDVLEQRRSFGDQYLWSICRPGASAPRAILNDNTGVHRALAYAQTEASRYQEAEQLARQKNGLVLWGMSTKGVILSNLMSRDLLRGGVDMNGAKQGRFAPVSGLEIHGPQWLHNPDAGSTILVMNPNYKTEIANILKAAAIKAELICF